MARRNRSVYGHHGTTQDLAQEILEKGFEQSEEESDWLGYGIYFWEDSPMRAHLWGEEKYPSEPICVIDAEISLERCLNLADPEGVNRLKPYYRFQVASGQQNLASLKSTEGYRQLDCRVINLACERMAESGNKIHVVRGAFEEGEYLYEAPGGKPHSQIRDRSHVQLAVRDPEAILDVEIDEEVLSI